MKINKHITSMALWFIAVSPVRAVSNDVQNTVQIPVQSIGSRYDIGSPNITPSDNAQCRAYYGAWIGKTLPISYQITPEEEIATALLNETKITLHPGGIQGQHMFISDFAAIPAIPDLFRVVFKMNENADPNSSEAFLYFASPNLSQGTYCRTYGHAV